MVSLEPLRLAEARGLCRPTILSDTDLEKSDDEQSPAEGRIHPSCQTKIQSKSHYRHQRNVVHLFSVASYKTGWPFTPDKLPVLASVR
jgi:hypothetical protein